MQHRRTHTTLVTEVEWDHDSEMSCHSFREGLPPALARKIIDFNGMPTTLTAWEKAAQKYHSQWAMSKALGYTGRQDRPGKKKKPTHWNHLEEEEERNPRDPDAMDVRLHPQMHPDKKEQLMKSRKMLPDVRNRDISPEIVQTETELQFVKLPSKPRRDQKGKKKPYLRHQPNPPPMNPSSKDKHMYYGERSTKTPRSILQCRR